MAQPFVIYQGQTIPALPYAVTINTAAQPLTGCTVTFSMRAVGSSTLAVSAAAATITDSLNGLVQYAWSTPDTAAAGTYVGWFTVTFTSGKSQDTPEFEIEVASHATAANYALVSLEELEDHLRLMNQIRTVQENDKQTLRRLILTASSRCAEYTNHRFAVQAAVAHTFRYDGDVVMDMAPYDLRAITSITMDSDGSSFQLDPAQYRPEPRNSPYGFYTHLDLEPYQPGRSSGLNFWGDESSFIGIGTAAFGRQVTVLGDWGWTSVPESIKHGVMTLAARLYMNPLGAQIVETAQTKITFTRGGAGSSSKGAGDDLPDDVRSAWRPFVRAGF